MQSRNKREGRYVGTFLGVHKRMHWNHLQKGPWTLPPHVGTLMACAKIANRAFRRLKILQAKEIALQEARS